MVALARKTLVFEWRRFLPAALAVAFSGLLLLMQAALLFGIFDGASVYIRMSDGELWAGYPGTQSIELGRPVSQDAEVALRMDADVARVEPFRWFDADWRGPAKRGGVSIFVSGIDARPEGLLFRYALSPELRARLLEPSAVIVDRADLPKLGLNVGDTAAINGHRVRIVGAGSGLRALGGVNVLTSLDTAATLDTPPGSADVAYYVAKLRDPSLAETVAARVKRNALGVRVDFWTRDQFARRAVLYWMFETGAGLGFLFLAGVVLIVGVVITSQTLMSAIAGTVREYATLYALGVGFRELRKVVLEQAFWLGVLGLFVGGFASFVLIALARHQDVPVALGTATAGVCALLVLGIAMASGLMSLRALRHADPATLLR